MTHEQKPESAEFRAREDMEQELAIIICEARGGDPFQMTYQTVELGVMEPFGDAWCHYLKEAKAVLDWYETEARGAAEQRRKDAEGQDPAGYRHRLYVEFDDYERIALTETPESGWDPIKEEEGISYTISPLYTRSPNVAALEARVRELEGAMEHRIAEAVAAEREQCARFCDEISKGFIEKTRGNDCERDFMDGGAHALGMLSRALRTDFDAAKFKAAAIREGSER